MKGAGGLRTMNTVKCDSEIEYQLHIEKIWTQGFRRNLAESNGYAMTYRSKKHQGFHIVANHRDRTVDIYKDCSLLTWEQVGL